MQTKLTEFTCDIQLQAGEPLSVPKEISNIVGPGHWVLSIRPASAINDSARTHAAFLNSYAPEDEGLYDDYSAG